VHGQLGAAIAYPWILVGASFGMSIFLVHILGRYRVAAAHAEAALRASHQRLHEEAQVSTALARVGQELIASLDTPALLQRLSELTREVFGSDTSHTFLPDAEGNFAVAAGCGVSAEEWESLRALPLPHALTGPLLTRLAREGPVRRTSCARCSTW